MSSPSQTLTPEQEASLQMMEPLWTALPRLKDPLPELKGEYAKYGQDDPKYLYATGFVDAERFTLKEWEAFFKPYQQKDGFFYLSKEAFFKMGLYRYWGRVKKPLNVMELREGWYELEVWRNFRKSILEPQTTITPSVFDQFEQDAVQKRAKIVFIGEAEKNKLKQILDQYPSPLRIREVSVDLQIRKLLGEAIEQAQEAGKAAKSSYAEGAKLGEKEKKGLSETLLKTEGSMYATKAQEGKELFSLKDLRKASIKNKK